MYPVVLLRFGLLLAFPFALLSTVYLLYYPIFHKCAFPIPPDDSSKTTELSLSEHASFIATLHSHVPETLKPYIAKDVHPFAPFRLLAIGDPQLEGDTSIPTNYIGHFRHIRLIYKRLRSKKLTHWNRVRMILHDIIDLFFEDIPYELESIRKKIDLWGNDYYLAHIYRTIHWWTQPSHVSVLGDLVGSQWINTTEFEYRGHRFWKRIFKGGSRVPDEIASYPSVEYNVTSYIGVDADEQSKLWRTRFINVAGNHDIGYAGDITPELVERFERVFGKVNYDLRFQLPPEDIRVRAGMTSTTDDVTGAHRVVPELRLVILNDMNMDTPAKSSELQDATYNFINDVIRTSPAVEHSGHFTIVLTHIPLYKPKGVCVDEPFFDFHPQKEGGGVREQNFLSSDASRGFLEGIFGMSGNPHAPNHGQGRPGVILNGHDHAGCDTYHFINQTNGTNPQDRHWEVARWSQMGVLDLAAPHLHNRPQSIDENAAVPGIREITVRSIMGEYGGNTGLFSAWFDYDTWEWKYEFSTCALGTQHVWWLIMIMDSLLAIGCIVYATLKFYSLLTYEDVDSWEWEWQYSRLLRYTNSSVSCIASTETPISEPKGDISKTQVGSKDKHETEGNVH